MEVGEEWTKGTIASTAVITLKSTPHFDKVDFMAGHPLIIIIREDVTRMVMFIGHVLNPLNKQSQSSFDFESFF